MQKSEIILVGETKDVDRATSLFGCKLGKLTTSYVGLPLGPPHKLCGVWDTIEERFKRKLTVWKNRYLSKGGRLVLMKSTLIKSSYLFYVPPYSPQKSEDWIRKNSKRPFKRRFERKEKDVF